MRKSEDIKAEAEGLVNPGYGDSRAYQEYEAKREKLRQEYNRATEHERTRFLFATIGGGIGGVLLLATIIASWPFASVPAGHRGVMTAFGHPSETIYTEGIHFRMPVRDHLNLVQVSVRTLQEQAQAASRDLQTVHTKIALNYHVRPAASVTVFRDLSNDPEQIVAPAIQEAVKAVTAQYTADELISKRDIVSTAIHSKLSVRLAAYGLLVDGFSIVNFDFSPSFNQAIEAKVTAEQSKLKADRDLERMKVEAAQKVVAAQAEAQSLAVQRQQITPELLQLRAIENQRAAIAKWNGQLPQFNGGQATPFIQLPRQE